MLHHGALASAIEDRGLASVLLLVPSGEEAKSLQAYESLLRQLAGREAHRDDCDRRARGRRGGGPRRIRGLHLHAGAPVRPGPDDPDRAGRRGDRREDGREPSGGEEPRGDLRASRVAVLADVDASATLDERDYRSGLAEVAKYALTLDAELLALLETRPRPGRRARAGGAGGRGRAVRRARRPRTVAADERDTGDRLVLNYGHTLGHALERLDAFAGRTHGEAVAIGMVFAARLAESRGLAPGPARRARTGCSPLWASRPSGALPPVAEVLLVAFRLDKKYRDGVRFVLLEEVGRARRRRTMCPTSEVRADPARRWERPHERAVPVRPEPRRAGTARPGDLRHRRRSTEIMASVEERARRAGPRRSSGVSPITRESSSAGCLGAAADGVGAVVINPGALTHYSYALRDAIEACGVPVVEVHMSNIHAREDVPPPLGGREVCRASIIGLGAGGYHLALEAMPWITTEEDDALGGARSRSWTSTRCSSRGSRTSATSRVHRFERARCSSRLTRRGVLHRRPLHGAVPARGPRSRSGDLRGELRRARSWTTPADSAPAPRVRGAMRSPSPSSDAGRTGSMAPARRGPRTRSNGSAGRRTPRSSRPRDRRRRRPTARSTTSSTCSRVGMTERQVAARARARHARRRRRRAGVRPDRRLRRERRRAASSRRDIASSRRAT